jgi:acyl carrier protein
MSIAGMQQVFREVFSDPELLVRPETTASDVAGWDSFAHINLVIALEEQFGITFTTAEIAGMRCVGDLVKVLQDRGIDVSWT